MNSVIKYVLAGDHYAVDLSKKVEDYLKDKNMEVQNVGSADVNDELSLQEMIPRVTKVIDENTCGILICGTGVGVEVGANRFKGVRASLCTSSKTATDARQYDKANVLCLSAWQTSDPAGILDAWLATEYDGDEGRLAMFDEFDRWAK
jgi:ribose 5-phosphate isomerase B